MPEHIVDLGVEGVGVPIEQWEFDTGAGITSSPAIAAGRIVVGTEDGRVYCFG